MTGMVIAVFPAAGPASPHCAAKAAELISRKSRRSSGLDMLPPASFVIDSSHGRLLLGRGLYKVTDSSLRAGCALCNAADALACAAGNSMQRECLLRGNLISRPDRPLVGRTETECQFVSYRPVSASESAPKESLRTVIADVSNGQLSDVLRCPP